MDDQPMLLNIDRPFRRGMLHVLGCGYIPIPTGTEFKPVEDMGRDGGWFSVNSASEAENVLSTRLPGATLNRCPNCLSNAALS